VPLVAAEQSSQPSAFIAEVLMSDVQSDAEFCIQSSTSGTVAELAVPLVAAEEQSSQPSVVIVKVPMIDGQFCVQPSTSGAAPLGSTFSVDLCHMSSFSTTAEFEIIDGTELQLPWFIKTYKVCPTTRHCKHFPS